MSRQLQAAHQPAQTPPVAGRTLQRVCACGKHAEGGECAECKRQRLGTLQRVAASDDAGGAEAPPIVHDVLRSPGKPLDDATRAQMEPRFGHDFGSVRVHTDGRAAASARAVNAVAYTVGNHIAFDTGRYQPATSDGRHLLAHELTHTVQNGVAEAGHPGVLRIGSTNAPAEAEASKAANSAQHPGITLTGRNQPSSGRGAVHGLRTGEVYRHFSRPCFQPSVASPNTLRRQPQDAGPQDAGPSDDPARNLHLACVIRAGACTTGPNAVSGGVPTAEDIQRFNSDCRNSHPYTGPDVTPTDEECRNPPEEPLSTAEKILLGAFLVAGTAAAIVFVAAAAEVIIPVAIAAVEVVGTEAAAATAFYYANAIVINEIGLFTVGLVISCEGDVTGLLNALANDPAQAAVLLAEVYILHVNIRVATEPARPAMVPVKLQPASQQTDPKRVKFEVVRPPTFKTPEPESLPEGPPRAPIIGPPAPPPDPELAPAGPPRARGIGPPTPPSPEPEPVPAGPPRAPIIGPPAPPTRFIDPSRGPLTSAEDAKLAQVRKQFALPVKPTKSDTSIVGILILENGEELPIHSGMFGGPSGGVHRGGVPRGPGSGASRYNITHVESHAAAIMGERGVKRAVLLIEKEPCASCAGYPKGQPQVDTKHPNLTKLLPKDAQLLVVDSGSSTYFRSTQ